MTETKPLTLRSEYVQNYMRQFKERHIDPAQELVRASPDSLEQEARRLFCAAQGYFRSVARGRPGNKEALYLFAFDRLVDVVRDEVVTHKAIGDWESRGSQYQLAHLILYPLSTWPKFMWSGESGQFEYVAQPGLVEYARLLAVSAPFSADHSSPPPPPRDPVELDLESKILQAEQELERSKAALRAFHETKARADQEKVERERVAKERSENETRERQAREKAERERLEREAREKSERERRAREEATRRSSAPPVWATILELTPPYTESQIRGAYRRKAKLTHPDHGGSDKEFREVDSAYDLAMTYCRSLRV